MGNLQYGVDQGNVVGISNDRLKAILEHCQWGHVWARLENEPELPVDSALVDPALQFSAIRDRLEHLFQMLLEVQSVATSTQHTVRTIYMPTLASSMIPGPGDLLSILPYLKIVTGS